MWFNKDDNIIRASTVPDPRRESQLKSDSIVRLPYRYIVRCRKLMIFESIYLMHITSAAAAEQLM